LIWLHALAQAVCAEGRAALKRETTFAEVLDAVAVDLDQRLRARGSVRERILWLQEAAAVPDDRARREADRVVSAVAAELPAVYRAQLAVYLAGAPASIRQVLRRPADATGTRVPLDLPVAQTDDLLPLLPPRPSLYQPGDRPDGMGAWRLAELLGLSATGEVWKALPLRDKKAPVVLKFCAEPIGRDPRLFSEANQLIEVLHVRPQSGVVALEEIYLDRTPAGVRYELVEGGSLGGLIQKWARCAGVPQVDLSTRFLLGLAQIVAGMHRLGVVHGDLKPAHVLLQKPTEGTLFTLRVSDYGLSRVLGGLTRERQYQGIPAGLAWHLARRGAYSPLYASPCLGADTQPTPEDDVYALGVIGLQMLCADLTAPVEPEWRQRLDDLGVPPRLMELLSACLADELQNRITSASLTAELFDLVRPSVRVALPASVPS
jgi:hypothetical protein